MTDGRTDRQTDRRTDSIVRECNDGKRLIRTREISPREQKEINKVTGNVHIHITREREKIVFLSSLRPKYVFSTRTSTAEIVDDTYTEITNDTHTRVYLKWPGKLIRWYESKFDSSIPNRENRYTRARTHF